MLGIFTHDTVNAESVSKCENKSKGTSQVSERERLSLLGAPNRAGSLEPRPDPGYTVIRGAIQILGVRNSGQQASRIGDALHFLHPFRL